MTSPTKHARRTLRRLARRGGAVRLVYETGRTARRAADALKAEGAHVSWQTDRSLMASLEPFSDPGAPFAEERYRVDE